MSIECFGDEYILTCDYCGYELEVEYDFYDAVNAKKAHGWQSVKHEWGWCDYCPDCYIEVLWEE